MWVCGGPERAPLGLCINKGGRRAGKPPSEKLWVGGGQDPSVGAEREREVGGKNVRKRRKRMKALKEKEKEQAS